MLLATWNAFALPVELSLEPEELKSNTNTIATAIIDICFFIDIIIIFRTAIYGENMDLVTEPRAIAVNYLAGNFWIDFLSTVPLDTLAGIFMRKQNAERFKLFAILKLIRVVRLNRIIRGLPAARQIKATLKIMNLTFFLMLYVHCVGCMWYFMIKQDQLWVPPL